MSSLLRHPTFLYGEGASGFLLRLANENGLALSSLKSLGIFFQLNLLMKMRCIGSDEDNKDILRYARHLELQIDTRPLLWNHRYCRFCADCLKEHEYWRVGWELLFMDVCAKHECWLIDRCDACGEDVTWSREKLLRCNCGHNFAQSTPMEAPKSVVQLAKALELKLIRGTDAECIGLLTGLSLEQTQRVIRFLGCYGQASAGRLPQKVSNAGAMDVSWQITSIAAEVLSRWPTSFNQLLQGMLDRSSDSTGQRFPREFGFLYGSIFRRFAEPEFDFLRTAFESFVVEHWHGPIAKRNTRLSLAILERSAWVPANHAKRKLQISSSRLAELVRSGVLVGETRVSGTGRSFLIVRKDSLAALLPSLSDQIDLMAASEMLGLTKSRLRSVASQLFPDARKIEGAANRWAFSRASVSALLEACDAPEASTVGGGQVCMDHVLRYWLCSDAEIAVILVALRNDRIRPVGRLQRGVGISHLIFLEEPLRQIIEQTRRASIALWTIPEIAEKLAIKQEVAYYLVRAGMLEAQQKIIGRRRTFLVTQHGLDTFQRKYIFARDLAKHHKTNSRSLQFRLAQVNILPVVSPSTGTCRQAIYAKTPELTELGK